MPLLRAFGALAVAMSACTSSGGDGSSGAAAAAAEAAASDADKGPDAFSDGSREALSPGGGHDAAGATCPAVDGLEALVASLLARPGSCKQDSDCILQPLVLTCDGGPSYDLCAVPVNVATAQNAAAQISALESDYCGCDLGAIAECKPLTPTCDAGTCAASSVDGGPGACASVSDCPPTGGGACAYTCSDGHNPCANACIGGQCTERGCPDASPIWPDAH